MEQQKVVRKKKSRLKKLLLWLLVDLLVAAIIIFLLLCKPAAYHPIIVKLTDPNRQRVHPYLSKELLPQFNNGVQTRRTFRMTIQDKSFSEVIAQYKWPQEAGGVVISAPQVVFEPDRVVLMGTATIEGADLVVTVEVKPELNGDGLLNLNVEKVKIGAMNITPLAKIIGKQKYQERVAAGGFGADDIKSQVAGSLLSGQPFDPVIPYDGKKIRLKSIELSHGQLDAEFVPAK